MEPEYIEPTGTSRIKLTIAYIVFLSIYVVFEANWLPVKAYISSLPPCQILDWNQWIFVIYAIAFSILSISCFRVAIFTFKLSQSPVPGEWLLFRTKVKQGMPAKINGSVFALLSVLAISFPLYLWYSFDGGSLFCISGDCGC
jgi:hypothetical protein